MGGWNPGIIVEIIGIDFLAIQMQIIFQLIAILMFFFNYFVNGLFDLLTKNIYTNLLVKLFDIVIFRVDLIKTLILIIINVPNQCP